MHEQRLKYAHSPPKMLAYLIREATHDHRLIGGTTAECACDVVASDKKDEVSNPGARILTGGSA